jgi:hypothetical protein
MINAKYVSSKYLIDTLFRDYAFNPTDIDVEAVKEHIFDAMLFIGAPTAFNDVIETVTVVDYRAELPCGLIDLEGIRMHGTQKPLIYSSDTYHMEQDIAQVPTGIDQNQPYVDAYSSMRTLMMLDVVNRYYTYKINNNYIYVNFSTGDIDVAFKEFPMTDDGWPQIPDITRYVEGVKSYVAERIGFKMWMMGLLSKDVYQKLEQERSWYIASAGNAIRIPNKDQMESLKNQWLTLIPNVMQHAYGFKYLNRRQRMRTGTS